MIGGKISYDTWLSLVSQYFISFHRPTSVYCEEYMHVYRHIYTDAYLTAYRLYMDYRWYQINLRVKRFYTNRDRCDVLTEYLSLVRRFCGDWSSTP